MVARRDEWLSMDDFLALDRESLDQKYEYRNGRMVAMAGGSTHHGILTANMHTLLGQHLKGKPCFAFVAMTESSYLLLDCYEEDRTLYENCQRELPVSCFYNFS